MANRFDLSFDLNTGFARLIYTHSVLFGNVARLNLQFDVLDLNTGLALVVKMLPDGTFSSIWVNRDGIRTLFRFVNTLVRFRVDFVSWNTGFALVYHSVSLNIRIISSSSSSLVRYVLRLWNCSQLNKDIKQRKHSPSTMTFPHKTQTKLPEQV